MKLPEEFTTQMRQLLGEEYEEYEKSFEEPRAYGLRVNTAKISVEEFLAITPFRLTPVPWTSNGFYYDPSQEVTKHPHYYAGLYYVQEPSAMIPASRLPVNPGERVLDLCAAPGGKATELGSKLAGEGLLVANDISNSRARGLLKNLELFGLANILVTSEGPGRLAEVFPGYFDKILIDAPCSGEGMFRKDSAMIRSWMEKGPEYYSRIQRKILQEAARMLKPGGMILYSTCTFSALENEESIRFLLDTEPTMHLAPMEWYEGFAEGSLPHCIRIFPHRVRGEGHFAALVKSEDEREEKKDFGVLRRSRPGKLPEELTGFLESLHHFSWSRERIMLREGSAYLLPEKDDPPKGLRYLRTGLYLGECRKNRFEPSQALAMHLRMDQAPDSLSLSSEDENVFRYLKGETLQLPDEKTEGKKGWILVGTDRYPLGWAKAAGGSLRNKYYPGWRLQ